MKKQSDLETIKRELTILVVGESYEKRVELINLLLEIGFKHFEHASDGVKAFIVFKGRPIDLIISHWKTPNLTGLELLTIIFSEADFHKFHFFIITKKITRSMTLEAGMRGVSGILVEPLIKEDVQEKIEKVLIEPEDKKDALFNRLYKKAQRLTAERRYDEALNVYERMIKIHEIAEIYYNIGYIKLAQDDYNAALKAFHKAVQIINIHAKSFKQMGEIWLLKGEKKKAEKCFKAAVEKDLQRSTDKDTIEALNEALTINPENPNIFNHLGIVYRANKNFEEAIRHSQMALKIDPDDEHVYHNLARALFEDGQVLKAKEMAERALSLNPDLKEAIQLLKKIKKRS